MAWGNNYQEGNRQWNANLGYIDQLNARREEKSKASYDGDVFKWVSANMEIITSLSGYIEDADLDKLEEEAKSIRIRINNLLSNQKNLNLSTGQMYTLFFHIREKLYELDKKITKTLFDNDLLKLKKRKVTVEEHLEADYNH